MHYAPGALGACFGPPSLCQFTRFCQLLDARAAERADGCVVLGIPQSDPRIRGTAAILMGGYLVVQEGWSANDVARILAEESKILLPCPWYKPKSAADAPNLTVADCWFGFEMALKQGWLHRANGKAEHTCQAWTSAAQVYDASWLVPGCVLVTADPMSTVMDPNPATVSALGNTPKGWVGKKDAGGPKDFLSWCKGANVGLVVRANFSNESGLREAGGSYDKEAFTSAGIAHLDAPVKDFKGGIPDAKSISVVLERCKTSVDDGSSAVLVHCKGGFGRSVVYAACWIILKFNVPGRPLLAWLRMARPGAITTPDQERFLQGLQGRSDIEKMLPKKAASGGGFFGKLLK
eukprot:TRINITY_DN24085_c0_g1_i1.p1 TRINITY_DN24085_c0_g1~~TRINITY_DN24085_c0_g1_i1.p1  ORF type:complete len:349 (-),score=33.24 TRINITY_DN24085_c0_g1_i1:487-1533(-)